MDRLGAVLGFRSLIKDFKSHGFAAIDVYPDASRYDSQGIERRSLQSAGGSAIPTNLFDQVAYFQRTPTPMLNGDHVTLVNRSDGQPVVFPRLTADVNHGGTVTAEAAGINQLDPPSILYWMAVATGEADNVEGLRQSAHCPAGYRVVGGGFTLGGEAGKTLVTNSRRSTDDGGDLWEVDVARTDGQRGHISFEVQAHCLFGTAQGED